MWKRPRTLLLLVMVFVSSHGDIPLAAGFIPPFTVTAPLPFYRWSLPASASHEGDPSSRLAGRCRHSNSGVAEAAHTASLNRAPNCNCSSSRRTISACTAVSPSSGVENTSPPGSDGTAGVGSSSATAPSSPSNVATIRAGAEEANEQEGRNAGVTSAITAVAGVGSALIDPFGQGIRAARAATAGWEAVEGGSTHNADWDGVEGAAWTEFEDWLVQDTFSRYAIGSGKYVLWRRMVREVPELMERTPNEARQRWLRLTGRLSEGGREGGRFEERGHKLPGSPVLDTFYVQPPVLEQWEEIVEGEGMGSFRGNVFGQRGLADGTAMTTAPVDVTGRKIQDQYVATRCGVVYELGERRETDLVSKASSKMLKVAPAAVLALAGAFYAFTAISHHVQVEVFVI